MYSLYIYLYSYPTSEAWELERHSPPCPSRRLGLRFRHCAQ